MESGLSELLTVVAPHIVGPIAESFMIQRTNRLGHVQWLMPERTWSRSCFEAARFELDELDKAHWWLDREIRDVSDRPDCNCSCSTGAHDELTFGYGNVSFHGFWQFPCSPCARWHEKRDGKPVGTYWPFESK